MIDTLERPEATEPTEQEPAFQIDSDERAEWLLRKLANIDAEKARVKAQAEAILKSLDADKERLQHLFGSQLEHYCREKLKGAGNRRKSVHFLQGSCSFRIVPAAVKVTDPGAALAWAGRHFPEAVKIVSALDTSAYREGATQRLENDGELLPGCDRVPEREAFSLKFGGRECL